MTYVRLHAIRGILSAVTAGVIALNSAEAKPPLHSKPGTPKLEYYSGIISLDVDPSSGRVLRATMSKPTGKRELDVAAVNAFLKARFKAGTARHVEIPIHWKIKIDS